MTPAEVADRMNGIHISEPVCGQSTGELCSRSSFPNFENTRRLASGPLAAFCAQIRPFYTLLAHIHFASSPFHPPCTFSLRAHIPPGAKLSSEASRAISVPLLHLAATSVNLTSTLYRDRDSSDPGIQINLLHPQNCRPSRPRSMRSSPSCKTWRAQPAET